MIGIAPFVRDERAAGAAEFALVLPVFLLFLFGIIDAGRFMWEYNRAEKATQMGVRYAVTTSIVPSGLATYKFSELDLVPQGNPVPIANFEYALCTNDDCDDCSGSMCDSIGYDAAAFDNIVARMDAMYSPITDANVEVEYRNVGIGFAGDPNGADVAAMVTVRLKDVTFQPITCLLFACSISMPDFRAALTLEDGSGTVAN